MRRLHSLEKRIERWKNSDLAIVVAINEGERWQWSYKDEEFEGTEQELRNRVKEIERVKRVLLIAIDIEGEHG